MAPGRDSGQGRAGSRAPELPFVGRETQLGALVAAVEAAELGESVLALVAGEAGIGKTRLVNEVAARVSARVLWATPATPGRPVASATARGSGIWPCCWPALGRTCTASS